MSETLNGPCVNTDRELWREPPGDYYANSIHVTEHGGIGINVGGMVFVKSLRHWHELAKDAAAAEERGRQRGVEERDELRAIVREVRPLIHETFLAADAMTERAWESFLARIDAALAPRDSGKEG